ncbi:hypothetical protein PsYK624_007290 [Phanerochaete sordida]|uniref:Uncharacterized protein n=1 Tax=Phanerochaete sordida TaxID=48140 RepID=A0A9P3FY08_9APHY|nr:hypothetical protein PsYK624_007290 [Phanerochaete sordida]
MGPWCAATRLEFSAALAWQRDAARGHAAARTVHRLVPRAREAKGRDAAAVLCPDRRRRASRACFSRGRDGRSVATGPCRGKGALTRCDAVRRRCLRRLLLLAAYRPRPGVVPPAIATARAARACRRGGGPHKLCCLAHTRSVLPLASSDCVTC